MLPSMDQSINRSINTAQCVRACVRAQLDYLCIYVGAGFSSMFPGIYKSGFLLYIQLH